MPVLVCAIVGVAGSAFCMNMDENMSVGHLAKAINDRNPDKIACNSNKLQLFLAKQGDVWLAADNPDVISMESGTIPQQVDELLHKQIDSTENLGKLFGGAPTEDVVHVLVKIPSGFIITIGGDGNAKILRELDHYQRRGAEIQRNCREYCNRILDKIDSIYEDQRYLTVPFICVVGSSGMGKSQLAFALGGRRPWFYWPAMSVGIDSQLLYQNFTSIADAFGAVTMKDEVRKKYREQVLNCLSMVYTHEKLWIYGFILALLTYYDEQEDDSNAGMIHFRNKVSLNVDMCNRDTVVAFLDKLKAKGKAVTSSYWTNCRLIVNLTHTRAMTRRKTPLSSEMLFVHVVWSWL